MQSAKRAKKTFHCGVCFEHIPTRDSYQITPCDHRFCNTCIQNYVHANEQYGKVEIKCLEHRCKSIFTFSDLAYIFRQDPVFLDKYTDALSMHTLESEVSGGDIQRCPTENCNNMFAYVKSNNDEGCMFTCTACEGMFCIQCAANDGQVGPVHDLSCRERKMQLEADAAQALKLEEWKKTHGPKDAQFLVLMDTERVNGLTRKCPNKKCNVLTTKNQGCTHMVCTSCKTEYRWYPKQNRVMR
jgi:hypothetical protein